VGKVNKLKKINEKDTLIGGLKKPSFSYINIFMEKKYYVYMLLIENGAFYCGYTDDVQKRFQAHLEGKGAKYTKIRRPVKLVYHEEFDNKSEALKREHEIKTFSRQEKLQLISEE